MIKFFRQLIPFKLRYAFILIFIIFISITVYVNTLENNFIHDDKHEILENPWIKDTKFIPNFFLSHSWGFRDPTVASNYYHPLRLIVYTIQYRLFGTQPFGYHLTNVIIHTMVTVMVFLISISLFKQIFNERAILFPAAASLLFAVHPIHAEAVAWISGIAELLMSLFGLLSFFIYINTTEQQYKRYIVSAFFFLVAALFKVTAMTFLILFILYDYSFKKGFFSDTSLNQLTKTALFRRYMPFITAAIVYLSLRTYALEGFIHKNSYAEFNTFQIIINIFPLVSKYLEMLVVPLNLNFIHVFHPILSLFNAEMLVPLGMTTIFILCVLTARKKNIGLFFVLLWIIIPLFPVLYFPAFRGENVFSERYLYFSSVGFVIALSIFMRNISYVKLYKNIMNRALFLVFTIILVLFAIQTIKRNYVWRSEYTIWMDTLKKSPDSSTAHNNLGCLYYNRGFLDHAIIEYQIALSLTPDDSQIKNNLAVALMMKEALSSH